MSACKQKNRNTHKDNDRHQAIKLSWCHQSSPTFGTKKSIFKIQKMLNLGKMLFQMRRGIVELGPLFQFDDNSNFFDQELM
jgi:hypothetical protein